MSYKTTLNNLISNRGGGSNNSSSSRPSSISARVVDIILDESHPEYKNKGGGLAINGVFYKPLNKSYGETVSARLPFAFQPNSNIKTVPVIGEIVEIINVNTPSALGKDSKVRKYYNRIVNIWNNPNSSILPDIVNNPELDLTSKGAFKELPDVNPIKSAPGDIQIEGRYGQSLRFTGGKINGTSYIDDSNLGKPVIILSNGQATSEEGFTTLAENVDEDSSSIYMTADHQIPLTQASEKRDAYNEQPIKADQFKGNQVIMNGGRLFFNAKEGDILLSSISSIGLNTEGSINIDGSSYLCLDAPIMYLGRKARTSSDNNREAVLLGNQTEAFLENLLNLLEGMAKDMARARTTKGRAIPAINKRGVQARPVIRQLKNLINPSGPSSLKSKKVFTE